MARRSKGDTRVRKHVTTACTPCRKTKVKCDGNIPACRNCQTRGKDCSYRQRDDKRTIPLRIAVNLLAKRVGGLSQYIQEHGLEIPAMSGEDQQNLKSILQALGFDYEEIQSTSHIVVDQAENPTHQGNDSASPPGQAGKNQCNVSNSNYPGLMPASSSDFRDTRQPATFPTNLDLGPSAEESQGDAVLIDHDPNISLFVNAPRANIPPDLGVSGTDPSNLHQDNVAGDELPSADADDEFTNQLSWRLGRLQLTQDGQLRYFGSTSNLTLLDALVGVNFSSSSNTQKDTREILENANLNVDVDEVLEQHLLELYFAWQNPSLYLVDYELFWKTRQQDSHDSMASSYCSRPLVDAMCALGASYMPKYHPELVTFPRSLSEFFGERARTLLEWEFENPSLSTIQTLVILSNHEASSTRDTRGWLYSGMAMRLAFDLGLHLDMTPYVEKGIISTEECKLRRTIFWAAYLNEQFWGYYLGRPVRSPIAGATVQKPHWGSSPHSSAGWKPYGCLQIEMESICNPLETICHLWVSLYDLMMPLTDVLYGCSEVSKHALQELAAATVARLYEWKTSLPEGLDIDLGKECQPYLPHVLILHMQYYQLMIHCHRPYISKNYIQPQPPQGPGSSHARTMCIESAIAIAKVLMIYERLYGFRKANVQMVSFTFSAALILIFTTVPSSSSSSSSSQLRRPDKEHTRYLGTCFWALDEMGYCFENAKRTSSFLSTLQQQWHKRRRAVTEKGKKGASERHHLQWNTGPTTPSENGPPNTQGFSGYDQFRLSRQTTSGPIDLDPSAGGYWTQDYASVSEEALDMIDFMDPDLCNILLSEGIPRALV